MLEELKDLPLWGQVLAGIFLLALCGGVLSWLAVAAYLLRVPFNAKPGSLRGWLRFNPLNVIFYSDKLTAKGLVIRKRLLIALGCFFAFWSLGWLIGLIAKAVS